VTRDHLQVHISGRQIDSDQFNLTDGIASILHTVCTFFENVKPNYGIKSIIINKELCNIWLYIYICIVYHAITVYLK
jgi:hypothetical protein